MVYSNSPLRYLDYDVTKYLYETYYPTQKTKLNYNKVVEEFKYLREKYDVIDHYVLDIMGIKYRSCSINRAYFSSKTFLQEIKYSKL